MHKFVYTNINGSFLYPAGRMSQMGDIGFMSVRLCVRACISNTLVLCVRDSDQTAYHICTNLVPINCTIMVDVQHTFHFDLISDPGQGHKNLVFQLTLYKTGGIL